VYLWLTLLHGIDTFMWCNSRCHVILIALVINIEFLIRQKKLSSFSVTFFENEERRGGFSFFLNLRKVPHVHKIVRTSRGRHTKVRRQHAGHHITHKFWLKTGENPRGPKCTNKIWGECYAKRRFFWALFLCVMIESLFRLRLSCLITTVLIM